MTCHKFHFSKDVIHAASTTNFLRDEVFFSSKTSSQEIKAFVENYDFKIEEYPKLLDLIRRCSVFERIDLFFLMEKKISRQLNYPLLDIAGFFLLGDKTDLFLKLLANRILSKNTDQNYFERLGFTLFSLSSPIKDFPSLVEEFLCSSPVSSCEKNDLVRTLFWNISEDLSIPINEKIPILSQILAVTMKNKLDKENTSIFQTTLFSLLEKHQKTVPLNILSLLKKNKDISSTYYFNYLVAKLSNQEREKLKLSSEKKTFAEYLYYLPLKIINEEEPSKETFLLFLERFGYTMKGFPFELQEKITIKIHSFLTDFGSDKFRDDKEETITDWFLDSVLPFNQLWQESVPVQNLSSKQIEKLFKNWENNTTNSSRGEAIIGVLARAIAMGKLSTPVAKKIFQEQTKNELYNIINNNKKNLSNISENYRREITANCYSLLNDTYETFQKSTSNIISRGHGDNFCLSTDNGFLEIHHPRLIATSLYYLWQNQDENFSYFFNKALDSYVENSVRMNFFSSLNELCIEHPEFQQQVVPLSFSIAEKNFDAFSDLFYMLGRSIPEINSTQEKIILESLKKNPYKIENWADSLSKLGQNDTIKFLKEQFDSSDFTYSAKNRIAQIIAKNKSFRLRKKQSFGNN